jgi:hypothetical protein
MDAFFFGHIPRTVVMEGWCFPEGVGYNLRPSTITASSSIGANDEE